MRAVLALAATSLLALALAGCGKPFDVKTAPGFVPLENQSTYAYRATTPDGVVMAVRVVEEEKRGDLDFWTKALTLQLHDEGGYAILATADVVSRDGTKGRLLKLGHDEDKKPYDYWVAIFLAQDRLFVVEAGGTHETFERARPSIEWMMKTVRVRCDTIVSPVLASRTCNRW